MLESRWAGLARRTNAKRRAGLRARHGKHHHDKEMGATIKLSKLNYRASAMQCDSNLAAAPFRRSPR
jgi:hypothetical protein